MRYLVAYDIKDNKRRTKLSELLELYGTRVNYSVFEIELSKKELKKLLKTIKEQKLIKKKVDSLRFYHLCINCIEKSFEVCKRANPFEYNYNAI